jgi:hypothetical protein
MFQTLIAIWTLVHSLMPMLISIVDQIEAAFPQSGQGSVKLEMVKGMMSTAFAAETQAKVTFDAVWPTLSAMVAGIVALKKLNPAPAQAPVHPPSA